MQSTVFLTLLLALCTMLGPLGIDTYLPSFRAIGDEFQAPSAVVQQTLSVYVFAMAGTMLFYGTISDTFGRKRVLLIAALGFAITSFIAAFVPSIEALLVVRFIQGLTGGAGLVITRAMVQDRFQGPEAQRMMAMVMFCFGLAPALAPIFGGWLQTHGGWRATFYFLCGFGLLLALLCWKCLPETLPIEKRTPMRMRVILGNYWQAMSRRSFRWMVLGLGLMASGTGVYVSAAPEFVMGILKMPETAFGWVFIPLISGTMAGSALSGVLATRLSTRAQKRLGYACMLVAAAWNISYHLLVTTPGVPGAVLPITLYTFGISLLLPLLSLEVLGQFPTMRGLASSLQGFMQMGMFAFMAGAVVPHLFHSGLWLAVGHALAIVSGMLIWQHAVQIRRQEPPPAEGSPAA